MFKCAYSLWINKSCFCGESWGNVYSCTHAHNIYTSVRTFICAQYKISSYPERYDENGCRRRRHTAYHKIHPQRERECSLTPNDCSKKARTHSSDLHFLCQSFDKLFIRLSLCHNNEKNACILQSLYQFDDNRYINALGNIYHPIYKHIVMVRRRTLPPLCQDHKLL